MEVVRLTAGEAKAGISNWQGGLVARAAVCWVVNSSTAFYSAPAPVSCLPGVAEALFQFLGSFTVHLLNTHKNEPSVESYVMRQVLRWCRWAPSAKALTCHLYSISEICTADSRLTKGFKICPCVGSNCQVFNYLKHHCFIRGVLSSFIKTFAVPISLGKVNMKHRADS